MATMSTFLPDPEQWYSDYEAASPRQRHQMLQSVIEQPLSPEFLETNDLVGILLDMQEELVHHHLWTEALALIAKFQEYQPELYAEEYPFLDQFFVQYYLYTSELEKVQAALVRFKENPAPGIDQMLQILDWLKFYNATEIASDLCRATYATVENSPEVIGGTEAELASVILMALMDSAYRTIQQGQAVDWPQFLAEGQKYGYDADSEWIESIQRDLTEEIEINEQLFQGMKKQQSQGKVMRSLSVEFNKYMATEKQVSFICSQGILENLMDFLIDHRQLKKKQLAHPDSLFGFSQNQLDRFLAQQIGGLFSLRQAAGFATLWGIPYFYDFLLAKGVIEPKIHQRALTSVTELKKQLIAGFSQLWKFDFVHRWLPPDSISQADWDEEAQQFAASTKEVKPLSDEPQPTSMGELFPLEFRKFFGEKENEKQEQELPSNLPESTETEPTVSSPSVKISRPAKIKKSPLQEAAELSARKPKKLAKKRKKSED
jgi:hypothetical protein